MSSHFNLRNIEQKHLFPAGTGGALVDWLEQACVGDPVHGNDIVSSIYFDTPGLLHYGESSDGDFQKSKLRLRWYEAAEGPVVENAEPAAGGPVAADPAPAQGPPGSRTAESTVTCFLEVKQKHGQARAKRRLEISLPAQTLGLDPFSAAAILDLPLRAFELGFLPSGALLPVLLIRYHRRRYLDPETRARIAVDTEICCPEVNQSVLPALPPVQLDLGVLEVKGPHRGLPPSLRPLRGLLTRSPLSKYARCLEELAQPLGRRV